MKQNFKDNLVQKLTECPLFSRYLGPSLLQRAEAYNWFENRLIRSIIRNTEWVNKHEELFNEAKIEEVKNSDLIFNVLTGSDPFYDLRIFDALAEVRLIRWVRQNHYMDIEKLVTGNGPTPDFLMHKNEEVVIAEAKHFRERDYLPEFIEDWLSGLVLITGLLRDFGLSITTSDKYVRTRQGILADRKQNEIKWRQRIRKELSEEWLKKTEAYFTKEPEKEISIIEDLFIIWRSQTPQDTGVIQSFANTTPNVMFEKITENLLKALKQIKHYISERIIGKTPVKAIVFLSGTDPFSNEWDTFWETLSTGRDNELIANVNEARKEAKKLIGMPFELIIGKDNPVRYVPFPWPN
jgi:hypothetical protein